MICKCGKKTVGVEYYGMDPCHYDGVSEYSCSCGYREGRWTGKELKDGEHEPPFGKKHKKGCTQVMKTEMLCDQCRQSFEGQDWMMETTREVLCEECFKLKNDKL